MGVVLKKGRRERLNDYRRVGERLQWETMQQSANAAVYGDRAFL